LYAWSNIFEQRILQRRTKQETIFNLGEAKDCLSFYSHESIGSMMKSLVITVGFLSGCAIDSTALFHGSNLIDWLNWPLHMLSNFVKQVTDTMKAANRI
jgi:hypothetical protein